MVSDQGCHLIHKHVDKACAMQGFIRMTAGFGLAPGRDQQTTSHQPCEHLRGCRAFHVPDETFTAVLGGCVPPDR